MKILSILLVMHSVQIAKVADFKTPIYMQAKPMDTRPHEIKANATLIEMNPTLIKMNPTVIG